MTACKDGAWRELISYAGWIMKSVSPRVAPYKRSVVKLFLGIVFGIFSLFLAACAAGYFMPATLEVERSTIINAYPDDVFPLLNDLKSYKSWAALDDQLGQVPILTGGAESGMGQTQAWQNGPKGYEVGSREIMQESAPEFVQIQVSVNGQVSSTMHAILITEPGIVTVLSKREIPQPGFPYIGRLRGFMRKQQIADNLDAALVRLKTQIEANL